MRQSVQHSPHNNMNARSLMFQGTGSDVGKSTLVAGLCRIARRRGLRVAPFKPQNMSNNAATCEDGGEIGRAQALQAQAAGLELCTDFNPVLLKPQTDRSAQVVVHGKVFDTVTAKSYMTERRGHLLGAVMDSYYRLKEQYDLVLIEGAGSPAEINLRDHDIANMGFARAANVPVCLIGDIDRGGVIAAIVGTRAVLDNEDAQQIVSFIINRFRGDPSLFDDGVKAIEQKSGWPCRGVVPWLPSALRLPQEDAVVLERSQPPAKDGNNRTLRIAVPMLSRIANFDDLDPLRMEPSVKLTFIPPGQSIPLDCDAIIIPGTKSTIGDLAFMQSQGWDHDVIAFARHGGRVLGLCGGYQLLGRRIHDPDGVDGKPADTEALGLLDVETTMLASKTTHPVSGHCARSNHSLSGYEIHNGNTRGKDCDRAMTVLPQGHEGAISANGRIEGTYLHGLFGNDAFRHWWLQGLGATASSDLIYQNYIEAELDALADGLEQALDVDALFAEAR